MVQVDETRRRYQSVNPRTRPSKRFFNARVHVASYVNGGGGRKIGPMQHAALEMT